MRTISKYIAVLLLMLTASAAYAQKHRLTVISTVGWNVDIDFYSDGGNILVIPGGEDGEGDYVNLEKGESIILTARAMDGWKYDYMECDGKKIHQSGDPNYRYGDQIIKTIGSTQFIMPDHDVTIYVYATLDPDAPDLPGNPNPNRWNATTGELFISGFFSVDSDDMSGGNQSLKIDKAMQEFGLNNEDIKTLTLMGEVGYPANSLVFTTFYPYPNLETLDLRHTYGYVGRGDVGEPPYVKNLISGGFDEGYLAGLPNLKKLILPSNIEQIGEFRCWGDNPLLETCILYAPTPPIVRYQWVRDEMSKIPASCVLYVPEQSVSTYKADSVWGRHFADILPIPKGEAEDITVVLPDNFMDGRYMGMSLRLFNTQKGEETKYIIDERGSYLFRSMTDGEPYTAQILSDQDVLVASTDTMTLGNKPLEMTFKHVKQLYNLALTVQTPAEQGGTPTDVTDKTSIVWTDGMGNRIGTGNTLAKQIEGSLVYYGISLPAELATHYGVPPRTELMVTEGSVKTTITLAQPDSVILSGKVTDTNGKPIAMATVTASLMMNGTVGKTFTATADQLGRYELTALTGDLTLSVTARGYVAQLVSVAAIGQDGLSGSEGNLPTKTIDPIQLAKLSGPTIVYDFTYTATPAVGEESATMPGYSDYANVAITVYNETTGKGIENMKVAYPEVQLQEGAKAGDRIRLTASSLKESFMPVEATATLHEEKGDTVTFAIVQKGAIEASFERTNNQAVTASLYDAEGQLVSTNEFDEATMLLGELPDGQYTLVMMGSDPLLNKTRLLSDYASVGMTEGTDYVQKKVTVKSGTTAVASVEEVPLLDASSFYYTDASKTLFMPNKTEVSASCNVTLRADIGFKDDIKERVSNVRLLVDYPSFLSEFVEGSSMTGNKMVRATAKNGRITIPVEKEFIDDPVRFILTGTAKGVIQSTAYVQFDIDGREVTQPIGFASCEVKDMTIVAPRKIRTLHFPIRGNAPALSPVRLYAGQDRLVGETQSSADGSWQVYVELPDVPNLSDIPVYAVITTKQGREVKTETLNVTYDLNMIRPLHVYMYPSLVGAHGFQTFISDDENQRIDFDFDHPETIDQQWYVVNPTGKGAPFHFEIVFNTTDSTKVHNVVLEVQTVHWKTEYLPAEYDGNTGHWVCDINMQDDAVCNVDVDYVENTELLVDADLQYFNTHLLDYIKEGFDEYRQELDRLLTGLTTETSVEKRKALTQELAERMGVDLTNLGEDVRTDRTLDEIFADMEKTLAEQNVNIDDALSGLDIYNVKMDNNQIITHAKGIDPKTLLDEGYKMLTDTEGNSIYELAEEGHYVLVDFQNDVRIEVKGEAAEMLAPARRVAGRDKMSDANHDLQWFLNMYNYASMLIESTKGIARQCYKIFSWNVEECAKWIAEFYAKYGDLDNPLLTDREIKYIKNLEETKKWQEVCADVSNQLGNTGFDPTKMNNPVPQSAKGMKVSGYMKAISAIGEVFSWAGVLSDCKEGYDRATNLIRIYQSVPDPCEEDQAHATQLKKDISDFTWGIFGGQVPYFVALVTTDILSTETVGGGLKLAPETGGTSLSAVFGGILATLIKMGANWLNDQTYANKVAHYEGEIPLLQCDDDYKKKQDKWWRARLRAENGDPKRNRQMFRNVRVNIDPSGYVYEAVADNRVENATATIYFKQTGEDEYGDLHDEVVKWNAEEFRQQNPMLTDAEGKYAWDVPQGLWQVKIEKAGYETAYSDWLPVPPPQLDINIPLVRKTLPDVQTARAYEDGVEVTFNEYMRPESLTTDR
ncbi:MAG: carboxypeptidase regulatory-like domain-containing protein, partial [Bacteroidaceae bacterium]|nr:carboxypeptidase regulatory-like domain-containing protein [Bacteroidaceae bacterium]